MVAKHFYIFSFVFILLAFQFACGQTQSASNLQIQEADWRVENLKNQANELHSAFDKNNFDKFVELTHPRVIEKVGGKENLIRIMKQVVDQNPQIFETFSLSYDKPNKLVEIDGQLFGVIPQKIEGTTHNKHKIVQEGCIVGVSEDNGKTWKFVSGEKFNDLFPSLAGKIQIVKGKTFADGVEQ